MSKQRKRYLALRPDTSTPYSVCVRDKKGQPKLRDGQPIIVRFEPNVVVEVDAEVWNAAQRAIGPALVIASPSKENAGAVLYDWDSTCRIQEKNHRSKMDPPVNRPANAGSIETDPKPNGAGQSNAGGSAGGEDDSVSISDQLGQALEKNAATFPELTPEAVQEFIKGGGDLEKLDSFTPELANELRIAVGIETSPAA